MRSQLLFILYDTRTLALWRFGGGTAFIERDDDRLELRLALSGLLNQLFLCRKIRLNLYYFLSFLFLGQNARSGGQVVICTDDDR